MNRIWAALTLILLTPLLLYIMIRIRLDSSGPVFFKQHRIGRDMRDFVMFKFRTMYHDKDNDDRVLTEKNDNRITSFGKRLRKCKLDELPQLWNIIKGDMNWFGPRPEQRYYAEQLIRIDPTLKALYQVKPGLISLGVIRYGYAQNVIEMTRRTRYDRFYLDHRSWELNTYLFFSAIQLIISR